MSDVPSDDAPDPDRDEGTPDLLADALSPVIAPENTDEERLKEPTETQPAEEGETAD
ncbi:hypothetical protein [Arthrobacter sp. NPDC057013]|uniref:hypothetical protein n=1 Tax=Arthrobacter sp. NPDC057013 TaxID=3345999 RepID=UPI0036392DD9